MIGNAPVNVSLEKVRKVCFKGEVSPNNNVDRVSRKQFLETQQ